MNGMTLPPSGAVTMTTLEISGLTDKRHDNVMRDTRVMLIELHGEGGLLNFEDTHRNPQNGQVYPIYRLPAREVKILVTGYSITLRARVIDRLDELERRVMQPQFAIPQNLPDALRLAADLADQKAALEQTVAEQAPKALFHDQVVAAPDAISMGEAAKILGTGRTRLMAMLRQMHWLTRHNEPYQEKIEAGLLDVKLSRMWEHPEQGLKRSVTPLVTGKGLAKLKELGVGLPLKAVAA